MTSSRQSRFGQAIRGKKGFTLIEVIVVLVILAILAAIAVPALTGYIDKADEKKLIIEARQVHEATQSLLTEAYAFGGQYQSGSGFSQAAYALPLSILSVGAAEDNTIYSDGGQIVLDGSTFEEKSVIPGGREIADEGSSKLTAETPSLNEEEAQKVYQLAEILVASTEELDRVPWLTELDWSETNIIIYFEYFHSDGTKKVIYELGSGYRVEDRGADKGDLPIDIGADQASYKVVITDKGGLSNAAIADIVAPVSGENAATIWHALNIGSSCVYSGTDAAVAEAVLSALRAQGVSASLDAQSGGSIAGPISKDVEKIAVA